MHQNGNQEQKDQPGGQSKVQETTDLSSVKAQKHEEWLASDPREAIRTQVETLVWWKSPDRHEFPCPWGSKNRTMAPRSRFGPMMSLRNGANEKQSFQAERQSWSNGENMFKLI